MKRFLKAFISVLLVECLAFTSIDASAFTVYAADTELQEVTADEPSSEESTDAETPAEEADESDAYIEEVETDISEEEASIEEYAAADIIDGTYNQSSNDWTEYHYRDDYFYNDSTTYNPSLSTMSFVLARSAFTYNDDDWAYGYKNCEDLLTQIGFVDIEANDCFKERPEANTIGVCIGRKNLYLEDSGTYTTLIAIGIRGAGYGAEWAGNATIGASGEAQGFGVARDQVIDFLNAYLDEHSDDIEQNPKIWIAGFSRASAVTNLTGNFLDCAIEDYITGVWDYDEEELARMNTTRANMLKYNVKYTDVYAYGFEVPRGGVESMEAPQSDNLFCLVDYNDVVPDVAPSCWGFIQYGQVISTKGNVTEAEFLTQLKKLNPKSLTKYNNKTDKIGAKFITYNTDFTTIIQKQLGGNTYIINKGSTDFSSLGDLDQSLIDFTAGLIGSRENYAEKYQPYISRLIQLFMDADDKTALIDSAIDGATSNLDGGTIALLAAKAAAAERPFATATALGTVTMFIVGFWAGPLFVAAGYAANVKISPVQHFRQMPSSQ